MTFRILDFKARAWKTMGRRNERPRTGICDTYFGEGNLSNVNYSAPPFSGTGQSRRSASQTSNNQVDYINTDRRNADPTSMGGGSTFGVTGWLWIFNGHRGVLKFTKAIDKIQRARTGSRSSEESPGMENHKSSGYVVFAGQEGRAAGMVTRLEIQDCGHWMQRRERGARHGGVNESSRISEAECGAWCGKSKGSEESGAGGHEESTRTRDTTWMWSRREKIDVLGRVGVEPTSSARLHVQVLTVGAAVFLAPPPVEFPSRTGALSSRNPYEVGDVTRMRRSAKCPTNRLTSVRGGRMHPLELRRRYPGILPTRDGRGSRWRKHKWRAKIISGRRYSHDPGVAKKKLPENAARVGPVFHVLGHEEGQEESSAPYPNDRGDVAGCDSEVTVLAHDLGRAYEERGGEASVFHRDPTSDGLTRIERGIGGEFRKDPR
ncbi:hypothetical protein DFH09DRAFT_1101767 [Mycena vulgaris]|nr:hypothetical protein DFH09DRAFT_1101767 [Mycena vulgaris]